MKTKRNLTVAGELGRRIKLLRIHKGMKQKELAERLSCVQSSVSDWEKGSRCVPGDCLIMITEIFHIDLSYFDTRKPFCLEDF